MLSIEELGKHSALSHHDTSSVLVSSIPPPPPPLYEDHAIHDDLDVERLGAVLATRDLDDIRDNRTDDDQPDLETDDSSGGDQQQPKIKPDISLEAITEATDITTPVEMMVQETGAAEADHTSAQISDLSEMPREEDARMTLMSSDGGGQQRPVSETLFDMTDPEEEEDDLEEHIAQESPSRTGEAVRAGSGGSERTLLLEAESMDGTVSKAVVQMRIQKRQGQIDRKFERLSLEVSFETAGSSSLDRHYEKGEEDEAYVQIAAQLSHRDEEEAATSFDQLVLDNFAEDKSEDWKLSNEATPDMEATPEAIFGAAEISVQGEKRIL